MQEAVEETFGHLLSMPVIQSEAAEHRSAVDKQVKRVRMFMTRNAGRITKAKIDIKARADIEKKLIHEKKKMDKLKAKKEAAGKEHSPKGSQSDVSQQSSIDNVSESEQTQSVIEDSRRGSNSILRSNSISPDYSSREELQKQSNVAEVQTETETKGKETCY